MPTGRPMRRGLAVPHVVNFRRGSANASILGLFICNVQPDLRTTRKMFVHGGVTNPLHRRRAKQFSTPPSFCQLGAKQLFWEHTREAPAQTKFSGPVQKADQRPGIFALHRDAAVSFPESGSGVRTSSSDHCSQLAFV